MLQGQAKISLFWYRCQITEKPFTIKLGMSSSLTDVDSFRLLIAFKMSTSKTKDNNYISLNMKLE